jgi:hypothetical protein
MNVQIRLGAIRKAGGVDKWLLATHEDRNEVTPKQFAAFIEEGMSPSNLAKAINVPRWSMGGILSLYYQEKSKSDTI